MLVTLAQQDIGIGAAFQMKGTNLSNSVFSSPRAFISSVLPNTLVLAGLILLLLVIGGSLTMLINASNPEAQQKSKGVVTNAAIGFALIFSAYWIIQIVQTLTGFSILGN